jgi:amino acid transporter
MKRTLRVLFAYSYSTYFTGKLFIDILRPVDIVLIILIRSIAIVIPYLIINLINIRFSKKRKDLNYFYFILD